MVPNDDTDYYFKRKGSGYPVLLFSTVSYQPFWDETDFEIVLCTINDENIAP